MSVHFSRAELVCKCGCGQLPNLALIKMLEIVRHVGGNKPIVLSSAMRCQRYNNAEGGAKTSLHTYGMAVDVIRWGGYIGTELEGRQAIIDLFKSCNFWTINEVSWVHADMRNIFPEILKIRSL